MPVPLILVSNSVKPIDTYHWEVDNDISPRIDYFEIAKKIGADTRGYENENANWFKPIRNIESRVKIDFVEALKTARSFSEFSLYLSASEKSAIPISFLMAALGEDSPHILIGHHLSSIPKTRLYRYWKFREHINHVICVSKPQADFAINRMNFPESNVDFLFDKVDHKFFKPRNNKDGSYIMAVGQEQRDYQTLLDAIAGTKIKLIIVASSPWSKFSLDVTENSNVKLVRNIPFTELRDLYRDARIVVVPLFENSYGAGLNVLLEAMAMAKPLIVSETTGVCNYILQGETGLYVSPGNSDELREQLLILWEDSDKRRHLSSNARQAIQENMNIDIYVEKIVGIVERYV